MAFLKNSFLVLMLLLANQWCIAQEKVAFMEAICEQLDQELGPTKKATLKELLKGIVIETKYDLPYEFSDLLVNLEINEWEGPLHDSLRALAPGEFISDYINAEDLVVLYYQSYLEGTVFDVKAAVRKKWDEEMEWVEAYRRVNDSIYSSFAIGEKVYFVPKTFFPPVMYPQNVHLKTTASLAIIPCTIIGKIDSLLQLEVRVDDNIKAIKDYVDFINKHDFYFIGGAPNKGEDLMKIKKGQNVQMSFSHFQKVNPKDDVLKYTFKNSCFGNARTILKLQLLESDVLATSILGEEHQYVLFEAPGGFYLKDSLYKVVVNKKYEVLYFQNTKTKEKLIPMDCEPFTESTGYLQAPPPPKEVIEIKTIDANPIQK